MKLSIAVQILQNVCFYVKKNSAGARPRVGGSGSQRPLPPFPPFPLAASQLKGPSPGSHRKKLCIWAPKLNLRGPVFNIQLKITVHFHTQYMHCAHIRVSKTCWNENST